MGLQTKTGNDFISCTSNWAFLSMMLICETRQSVEGLCGVCLWPEAHLEERHETLSPCDHLALVWLLIVGARRQRLSPSPALLNGNSTCRGQHGAGRPAPCHQATSPQGLRNSGEKPHHFCPSSIQCCSFACPEARVKAVQRVPVCTRMSHLCRVLTGRVHQTGLYCALGCWRAPSRPSQAAHSLPLRCSPRRQEAASGSGGQG